MASKSIFLAALVFCAVSLPVYGDDSLQSHQIFSKGELPSGNGSPYLLPTYNDDLFRFANEGKWEEAKKLVLELNIDLTTGKIPKSVYVEKKSKDLTWKDVAYSGPDATRIMDYGQSSWLVGAAIDQNNPKMIEFFVDRITSGLNAQDRKKRLEEMKTAGFFQVKYYSERLGPWKTHLLDGENARLLPEFNEQEIKRMRDYEEKLEKAVKGMRYFLDYSKKMTTSSTKRRKSNTEIVDKNAKRQFGNHI